MDDRLIQFVAALRNSGVRVSVAESADALRAIDAAGLPDRDLFRLALRATLVKEAKDIPTFEQLFPAFFGSGAPPLPQQPGGGMSDEERERLEQQIEAMLQNMTPEQLRELFEAMMRGQNMTRQQMQDMLADSMAEMQLSGMYYAPWASRRAMRDLQFDRLNELLQELLEKLREAGISEEQLQELAEQARQNQQALAQQIQDEVGRGLLQRQLEERNRGERMDELLDQPFEQLNSMDLHDLRRVVNRLAAQLRSRAALRQKRASKGTIDVKRTIRSNLRYNGVPLEVQFRTRHLKPKLVIICDLSTSMRNIVSFLLLLVYALQDQVTRTRSFAFVGDLHDISNDFAELRPEQAIRQVLDRIRPGHYNTDLGASLATFSRDFMGIVDHRTTVIILGDGRNNHFDPNLKDFEAIRRRAHRMIWFNPEGRRMWGTGDSDMLQYEPLCDAVHHVSNLRQLTAAVETLFD